MPDKKKQRQYSGLFDRYTTNEIHLAKEGEEEKWQEIFRVGNWSGSYKQFEAKKEHLEDFVKNFDKNVMRYKSKEVPVNYKHESWDKAAGWIEALKIEGNSLMAKIRWTPAAQKAIEDEEYKYFSAEIYWMFKDQETKKETKNVLSGLALTNIPFVSDMQEARLAQEKQEEEAKNFHISHFKMDTIKELLASLADAEKITSVEFAKVQGAFLMLSEDEQSEVKEEVEGLEEKVEDETQASNSDEAEKLAAEAAKKDAELKAAKKDLSSAHSRIDKLEADANEKEVGAKIEALCEEGKLLPKDKDAQVKFAMSLSKEQAEQHFELLSGQQPQIDLSEAGTGDDGQPSSEEQLAKEIEGEAKKLKASGDSRPLDEIMTELARDKA